MVQSQLGTVNSTLAAEMSLGVLLGASTEVSASASNNLVFTDTAHGWIEDNSFSSTVTFVSTVSSTVFSAIQNVSANLGLSQSAVVNTVKSLSVSQTLNLTSKGLRVINVSNSDTLNFVSTINYINYVDDRKPAGNVLNFTQTVLTLSSVPASSSLNLTQTLDVRGPIQAVAYSFMGLTSHTSTPYRVWIEDTLSLSDMVRVPIDLSLTSTLNFVDVGTISTFISVLGLTDSVEWGFAHWIADTLGITDSFVYHGTFRRPVDQDLGIEQSLTWFEDSPCNYKQYTPFQGESTHEKPSDSLSAPQGSLSDRLSLYQPPLGVRTSEVILRAPEMDNRDRNAYNRVSRETRGGRLVVYADPEWPKIRTLALTIVGLTQQEASDLQTFIFNTVGQEIGLTDWEGNLWRGIITDPTQPVVQDGKKSWTATFEFEGELAEVEQPGGPDGMSMNLSQSVTAVIV